MNRLLTTCVLLCMVFSMKAFANGEWQTIPVPEHMTFTDKYGQEIDIEPACAMDPIVNPATGDVLENRFQFYFKQGSSKNLIIFFNGGGACWNDATCVASLQLAAVEGARPTYNPSMYSENTPWETGGIFDDSNPDNPFKNWSKVFIPYCTGDIHVGSSEVAYTDETGAITGYPGAPVVIKHHGHDNVMAVREWIKNNIPTSRRAGPKHVLVTGASAGGYGAALNFPYFKSLFPRKSVAMFADGAQAIMTPGFVDSVISFDSNWNVEDTLPAPFSFMLGTFSAYGLNNQFYTALSYAFPRDRFAQYTTALDAVQVQFFKIADQVDQGNNNPLTWGLTPADYLYFGEWSLRMQASVGLLSAMTFNYQYYIGAGMCHTVTTDFCVASNGVPSPFYNESSAQGVPFSQWLYDFATDKRFKEHSVSAVAP